MAAKGVPSTGSEPAKDSEEAKLLFGLGRAHAAGRDVLQGVDIVGRAFEYYAEVGDVDLAVAIAEFPFPILVGFRTGIAKLIARALSLVPADSHRAGRLLSRYGQVMGRQEGDYEAAREAFERAVAIAQHHGNLSLEFATLANAAYMDQFHLRWQQSLEKSRRAIELSHSVDEPHAAAMTHYGAAALFTAIGDAEGARRQAADCLAVAEQLRDQFWLVSAFYSLAHLSRLDGNWEAARELSDRGLSVTSPQTRLLCSRAEIEYQLGDFDQGQEFLQRLLTIIDVRHGAEPTAALASVSVHLDPKGYS